MSRGSRWFDRFRGQSTRPAKRMARRSLQVECLETRAVPATLTVTGTGDTIAVDGFITLREAITSVNAGANVNADVSASGYGSNDTIEFNISGTPGNVHTIQPQSALPTITAPVTIDGYSQLGASANTLATGSDAFLAIELDGTNAGFVAGLTISAGDSTIEGLIINRFTNEGLLIIGDGGNVIRGNFIGTDSTGKLDRGNGVTGVGLLSSNNTIGGTAAADRNLISGNDFGGISIVSSTAAGNVIQGNLIGTDDTAVATLQNTGTGIRILGGSGTLIGGTVSGAKNVIAFNSGAGVLLTSGAGSGHAIVGNSIHSNGGLGIDLNNDGPTANDTNDADTGPNALQNVPVITAAISDTNSTTISGTLQSTPNKSLVIELFSNTSADSSGFGEGQTSLGTVSVTTNAQGSGSFTFSSATPVNVGSAITATATEFLLNNTSEFSAAFGLGTPQQKFVQALYQDVLGRSGDFNNAADAAYWANVLTNGTQSRSQVATSIERSGEARARLVTGWYQTYLNRTPGASETQFWVNALQQPNKTDEQVLSQLLASDEFFNRAQTLIGSGTSTERYVRALYQVLLGRQASNAEVSFWDGLLPTAGRSGIVLSFLTSSEYRTLLFTSYYQSLLNRAPDAAGLQFWLSSGLDALRVRVGLEASGEYPPV